MSRSNLELFFESFFSHNTRRAYQSDLMCFNEFLRDHAGDISMEAIDRTLLQKYRDFLFDSKKLCHATIHRRFVALRTFFKWCQLEGIRKDNPALHLRLPRYRVDKPTQALSDAEVLEMIESVPLDSKRGLAHRIILVLLANLGLRRSELGKIQLKDFNFERNHRVLNIWGKGNKRRTLPINPFLYREIYLYLKRLREDFDCDLTADDYLIQTHKRKKNSKPIDGSTIYRIVKKYATKIGVQKEITPHSLRATSISHLLDTQKVPIRDVAIFAGHSQITTTERYDKRRDNLDSSAAYKVSYEDS